MEKKEEGKREKNSNMRRRRNEKEGETFAMRKFLKNLIFETRLKSDASCCH
jgi:hypothetical protein